MGERSPQTILLRHSLPEIKNISEDRLLIRKTFGGFENKISEDWHNFHRSKKRQKVSNAALDKIDNTPPPDLISKLPDDILCFILSRLSMKDAVSTSILSKRWRHLWRKSLKNLCFDATNVTRDSRIDKGDVFVTIVNQILALHSGPATIESFRMKYCLHHKKIKKYRKDIDKWIEFAANKKVQKLDISFILSWQEKYSYWFPYWLFNDQDKGMALKHLTLTGLVLDLPPKSCHFSSLVSLSLKGVTITQVKLTNILSSCLSLQWLSMSGFSSLKKLKFTNGLFSSLKLKHLNISELGNLETIDIRDLENLMSFEFSGSWSRELLCNETAPITRVCCNDILEERELFEAIQFDKDFPQLETLLMFLSQWNPRDEPNLNLPTFLNLKHLILVMTDYENGNSHLMEMTVSFLKPSPFLKTLELHFCDGTKPGSLRLWKKNMRKLKNKVGKISSDCSDRHNNLKEVKIYNFHGEIEEVEVIEYLVNHTVTLDKIQIDRREMTYKKDGQWEVDNFTKLKIKRKTALKMLRKIISRPTKLIIL